MALVIPAVVSVASSLQQQPQSSAAAAVYNFQINSVPHNTAPDILAQVSAVSLQLLQLLSSAVAAVYNSQINIVLPNLAQDTLALESLASWLHLPRLLNPALLSLRLRLRLLRPYRRPLPPVLQQILSPSIL